MRKEYQTPSIESNELDPHERIATSGPTDPVLPNLPVNEPTRNQNPA